MNKRELPPSKVVEWLRSPVGEMWSSQHHSRENKCVLVGVIVPGYLSGYQESPDSYRESLGLLPLLVMGIGAPDS